MCRSKHTPGPWHRGGFQNMEIRPEDDSDRSTIANVHSYCGCDDECEANANLFMAAPDLLAALEMIVGDARPLPHREGEGTQFFVTVGTGCIYAARAAIAKAKGDPPCSTA